MEKDFDEGNEKWSDFLKEKTFKGTKFWYTHRKLRQAKSHIKNVLGTKGGNTLGSAIPYMFYFLEDINIKKSSNDLEGYNGILSDNIYKHRGLRIDRLISFISLWIYNRNL